MKPASSNERNDKKSEKKQTIASFVTNEKKEASPNKLMKSISWKVKNCKSLAIDICLSKYQNFEDLWKKYQKNIEELKKAKEIFLANYIKNQTSYQITFEKLKSVHFEIESKKLDNSLFLNNGTKFISWNIDYNPFILLSLINENISFDNLQVYS